jgi:hypothetical protein
VSAKSSRARYVLLVIALAALLLGAPFLLRESSPLVAISSNKAFVVSSLCTFGTNHLYYYGDPIQRVFDPAITRLSDTNANRLFFKTTNATTAIWVRLKNPAFAQRPPLVMTPAGPTPRPSPTAHHKYTAHLIERGADTPLELKTSLIHYKGSYYVGGWLLSGSLADHPGALLRVEEATGPEIVTFRIP